VSSTGQLDLFDEDRRDVPPSLNLAAFDSATDHRLDEHSVVTHVHGLVVGDAAAMAEIGALPGWEQRSRWMYDRRVVEPRLTNEILDIAGAPTFLIALTDALSQYCGVPYDSLWMNWYRDHDDSTGWHADRPANEPATAVVPVASLGATRRFLIRPDGGGPSVAFTPAGGDVIVMRGRCQKDWQHCVPKQRGPTGARISLNFNSSAQVTSGRSTPVANSAY
jgi:alkylated DNA repair dioxygenase AlkB